MNWRTVILVCYLIFACLAFSRNTSAQDETGWHDEIIYHVFQRSFYDADGDGHGDLKGVTEKLPYLKELGVTAILFVPLYESELYHNYFPTDYEKIDPEFGTRQDYENFIRAVHQNGLKFIMDMETQYAMAGHKWMESINHPGHPFTDFIYFHDNQNRIPERFSFEPRPPQPVTPENPAQLVNLNLQSESVKAYMRDFYASWIDPNHDGDFSDGVDGFRIDHLMDDLDNKHLLTNLYADFWLPLIRHCIAINPDLFIVAEQADWNSYGDDLFKRCEMSAVFGFPIRAAIAKLDAAEIKKQVAITGSKIPTGKHYINFIENHDIGRIAETFGGDPGKLRVAAVLNLTLPGIPSIYYGQELGISGDSSRSHLRIRQAFPWTPGIDDPGIAHWFRDEPEAKDWLAESIFATGETKRKALSVEKTDPESLWNFYKNLIAVRKAHPEFSGGQYRAIEVGDSSVVAFARSRDGESLFVVANLSADPKTMEVEQLGIGAARCIFGKGPAGRELHLLPFEFSILK